MPKEPFQAAFDFSEAEKANLNSRWDAIAEEAKAEKARARAAENAEYVDKRVKASPLVAEAELAKMKELLKPRGGAGSGGTGGAGEIKSLQNPRAMRKGGYVRAADGIAKRGKTKGRLV